MKIWHAVISGDENNRVATVHMVELNTLDKQHHQDIVLEMLKETKRKSFKDRFITWIKSLKK